MFRKQVSGPVDGLDPPSWPRRRGRSSELEERPAHGPNPSFCALQAKDHYLDLAVQMIGGASAKLDQSAQQQVHEREEDGRNLHEDKRPDPTNALA
jgi:hypothetical protein